MRFPLGRINEHGRRALVGRTKPTVVHIHGDLGTGVAQLAARYAEEVVRLRGAMQEAFDALDASPYQSAWNEAHARKILRDALTYEGWLRDVVQSPTGGGEAA